MKIVVVILLFSFLFSVVLSIVINCATRAHSTFKANHCAELRSKALRQYSTKNVININTSMSSRNGPVRPANESFFDGIIKELYKGYSLHSPEHTILKIHNVVFGNLQEDSNGAL